ncbi:MAG: squalene--hopene cyclase [Pirellulales bacterium]
MHAAVFQYVGGETTCLAAVQLGYWLLWLGSLALAAALVWLLWTRWGQSRPLQKCALLSLIVHLILAFLAMTVRIVNGDAAGGGGGGGPPIRVRIVEDARLPAASLATVQVESAKAFAASNNDVVAAPELLEIPPPLKEEPAPVAAVEQLASEPAPTPALSSHASPKPEPKQVDEPIVAQDTSPPTTIPRTAEAAPHQEIASLTLTAPEAPSATAKLIAPVPAVGPANAAKRATTAPGVTEAASGSTPSVYALRNGAGKMSVIAGQGGNAETEDAVAAALVWLAKAQSRDGRWDAVQYGGGREELVLGQNRGGAGRGADTGVTALALLAFLGAGHSHLQGQYQDNVRRGLDFLLRSQAADGNLYGDATLYAQMYCHSMATFALAEAQAVSNDRRLDPAVRKAVNYSLAAQNTSTGGWRYRPGDTGDTSQLGWQIMALASAERAGIKLPDITWIRVQRFLQTVQRGNNGGLASYRPDSPMSTSMTAEAFYCRLMLQELGTPTLTDAASEEATSQLLASLPSAERTNLYYWYYATLALHHRRSANEPASAAWRRWNDAMIAALVKSQAASGEDAGSWATETIWGGYGGRVYTTAMATMCLEVYYRYGPAPESEGTRSAARPQPIVR